MKRRFRTGGLAAWSIGRPIGVIMLALTVVVLGVFSLDRLGIGLLPHIIYPEIRVRVFDTGVPAQIMEDRVTRQLEEQLAITEGAISVQSTTSEGGTRISLSFPYGTDINLALRDASNRLDRAKRFLPDTIDPPVIYKRDPAQIPVLELAISSTKRNPTEMREWVDYELSRWFVNLPGVAAAEVGGGTEREIQVLVDQERLASLGLTFADLANRIADANLESPGGRINTAGREYTVRTVGRFESVEELKALPLWTGDKALLGKKTIRLGDVAQVFDTHEDVRFHVRLNGVQGIKLSMQKQPEANTVAVVDTIMDRMDWLYEQKLIPDDVKVGRVGDQAVYVRHALRNATLAATSGAILAMIVVYLFLGNIRRTLIIGSAIPLAILVTFIIMALGGLTLNIMTLGGLALGVGLLVDNTIVMLENITRHLRMGESASEAPVHAAAEVNSAIVASTSTNLAAILPFLFIGGLTGLLFSELIITLSAAILASLVVAITVVPTLGARVKDNAQDTSDKWHQKVDSFVTWLQGRYVNFTTQSLARPWRPLTMMIIPLLLAAGFLYGKDPIFLPQMDEGQVRMYIKGDAGTQLNEMDAVVRKIEAVLLDHQQIESVFATIGVRIFGRTERETSNSSTLYIQLKPGSQSEHWVKQMKKKFNKMELTGYKIRMRIRGVRGIKLGSGDDDLSLRVQGPDIDVLTSIGDEIVSRLHDIKDLRNVNHSYEEVSEEFAIKINRARAADLNINVAAIGQAVRVAMTGEVVSEYIDGDRQFDIRLRLPRTALKTPTEIGNILVGIYNDRPIRLREVARVTLAPTPNTIVRDGQRRIVEIGGSIKQNASTYEVMEAVYERLEGYQLPEGYALYDGGATKELKEGQQMGIVLVLLALFLVFVVMAVQYESLINPFVIMLSVPFTIIGVSIGLWVSGLPGSFTGIPMSMPVWLGLIMLAGIVVNNSIILVEQIEIERERTQEIIIAITEAARQRLRPILMTALTTIFGMLPLALGLGRGSEMLQPLAIVIVWGLMFSTLVSLVMVPTIYLLFHRQAAAA